MKYVIICVKDTDVNAFMPIQCLPEMLDSEIIESNKRAVISGKIPPEVASHSVLYKRGTFDDSNGAIDLLDNPVKLCSLAEFVPTDKLKELEVRNAGILGLIRRLSHDVQLCKDKLGLSLEDDSHGSN